MPIWSSSPTTIRAPKTGGDPRRHHRGLPERRRDVDRGAAIAAAMAEIGDGDVLLIAGKGHESFQLVGNETPSAIPASPATPSGG